MSVKSFVKSLMAEDAATMTRTSSETGSTSNDKSGARFDVFLSFRGPDTRMTFTDILYWALRRMGILVFIDKKGIEAGDEISTEIYQAINDSKICIPIFSTGYASSRWCLRELEHMMKRWKNHGLEVMPIFYDVKPSVVKLETGVYRDELARHKNERGAEIVQGWEDALKEVTRIKGWELWDTKNTPQGELTQQIAREVFGKLQVSPVCLPDPLVGIDKSVDKVIDLLSLESEGIRLVGICGLGGVGKTTLAMAVYVKLSTHFDSCSFIHDIREASESSTSLLEKQRKLVHDILGDQRIEIPSIDIGKNRIKDGFPNKKVLIVFDDVNDEKQLGVFAVKRKCLKESMERASEYWNLGLGSRILVTTRDKGVLDKFENSLSHEMEGLNRQESLELFSAHAFGSHSPPSDFLNLSYKAIAKAGGLPLTIQVIGSMLFKKGKAMWEAILEKMEKYPRENVLQHLKLSYETLDHPDNQIFLDIAIFLAGKYVRDATYMWEDCKWFPTVGINLLLSRSLVKIREKIGLGMDDQIQNVFWMHDQLKDLGRSLVLNESPNDLGKRTRVWNNEEALEMITSKEGTRTVEAICVDCNGISLTSEHFKEMPNIRFLEMTSGNFSGDFKDLFQKLRWLSWQNCPPILQATHFFHEKLLILELSRSGITQHWNGWTQLKVATRLKVLNLSKCKMLKETPDLSTFLFLEILILDWCQELTKLPDSIGMLQYLLELDISYTSIKELPDTIVKLENLKVLKMHESDMQNLPKAIRMMKGLEEIHGNYCERLELIPSDIGRLPHLKILALLGTRVENMRELPKSLMTLHFSSSAVRKFPVIYNLENLPSLRDLELNFGRGDASFVYYKSMQRPHAFYSSLRMKFLSFTIVRSFWGCLDSVRELELIRCETPYKIQQLSSGLRKLKISDCNLLKVIDLSNLENLLELILINNEICDIQGLEGLASLQLLRVKNCKLSKLVGLERLKNLRTLQLERCPFLQTLPNLSNLKNLEYFELWYCSELVQIEGIDGLESLEGLVILYCSPVLRVPKLSHLKKVKINWMPKPLDEAEDELDAQTQWLDEMIFHSST